MVSNRISIKSLAYSWRPDNHPMIYGTSRFRQALLRYQDWPRLSALCSFGDWLTGWTVGSCNANAMRTKSLVSHDWVIHFDRAPIILHDVFAFAADNYYLTYPSFQCTSSSGSPRSTQSTPLTAVDRFQLMEIAHLLGSIINNECNPSRLKTIMRCAFYAPAPRIWPSSEAHWERQSKHGHAPGFSVDVSMATDPLDVCGLTLSSNDGRTVDPIRGLRWRSEVMDMKTEARICEVRDVVPWDLFARTNVHTTLPWFMSTLLPFS